MAAAQTYAGQASLTDPGSDYNATSFIVRQLLGLIATIKVVKIIAVHGGGVAAVGTVDVQPLVNQIDGQGNSTPHGTIFNLPYVRLQGGANAVIIDPQVGDIGLAAIADRDISAVKSTKAQANPGSFRRFDFADGIYIGGILNGTPNQYVEFTATGISIVDLNGNQLVSSSAGWAMKGNLAVTGDVTATGDVVAGESGADQVSLQNHVQSNGGGTGNSGPPVAGT